MAYGDDDTIKFDQKPQPHSLDANNDNMENLDEFDEGLYRNFILLSMLRSVFNRPLSSSIMVTLTSQNVPATLTVTVFRLYSIEHLHVN